MKCHGALLRDWRDLGYRVERDKWSYEKRVWILRGSCIWNCHRRHVIIRVKIITVESCFWREKVAWWKESFPQEFRLSTTGKWTTSPLPPFLFFAMSKAHPSWSVSKRGRNVVYGGVASKASTHTVQQLYSLCNKLEDYRQHPYTILEWINLHPIVEKMGFKNILGFWN